MKNNILRKRLIINLLLIGSISALILLIRSPALLTGDSKSRRITQLERQKIQHIAIVVPNKPDIELILDGKNRWYLRKPYATSANPARVNMLLDLADAHSDTYYPVAGLNLADFKLDQPTAILKLNDAEFRFGNNDPIQHQRYLLHQQTLHLIRDTLYPLLTADSGGFASLQLLPDDIGVTRFKLQQFSLNRQATGGWKLQPDTAGLSADALQTWVNRWQRQKSIYIQHVPQAAFPLQNTITIELKNGQILEYATVLQNHSLLLYRPDIHLLYHLDQTTLDTLIAPPKPEAEP